MFRGSANRSTDSVTRRACRGSDPPGDFHQYGPPAFRLVLFVQTGGIPANLNPRVPMLTANGSVRMERLSLCRLLCATRRTRRGL